MSGAKPNGSNTQAGATPNLSEGVLHASSLHGAQPSTAIPQPLEILLTRAQDRLIAGSSRNPLLHYKLTKSSGIGIEGESPAALYRILVTQGKRMYFDSVQLAEDAVEPNSSEAPTTVAQPPLPDEMINDDRIQTPHSSTDLQVRLIKIAEKARVDHEDRGIHTLYLALGLISLVLPDEKKITAPIVLVPVTLERKGTQGRFSLVTGSDGPTPNYALEVHLKKNFNIKLPDFSLLHEASDDSSLESYFDEVASAIQEIPNATIDRTKSALGIFSFEGASLYNDLELSNWPTGKTPLDSPSLQRLVNRVSPPVSHESKEITDYTSGLPLVMPVDPSQLRCVARAANGEDLVIYGPPGTGKSHTITNIITTLAQQGKKILFVSQKAQALQIVERNLTSVGLGDLALLLDSDTMPRRNVINSIRETFNRAPPREGDLVGAKRRLTDAQDKLISDLARANRIVGTSGISFHDAVGRSALSGDLLDHLCQGSQRPPISITKQLSCNEFQAAYDTALSLQKQLLTVSPITNHLFFGSEISTNLLPDERDLAKASLSRASAAAYDLTKKLTALCSALNLPTPSSLDEMTELLDTLECIYSNRDILTTVGSLDLTRPEWRTANPTPSELLGPLEKLASIRASYRDPVSHKDTIALDAWKTEKLDELSKSLTRVRSYKTPALTFEYWSLRSTLRSFYVAPPRSQSWESWEKLLEDIQNTQALRWLIASPEGPKPLPELLTERVWKGIETDLPLAKALVSFGEGFIKKHSHKPYFEHACRIIKEEAFRQTLCALLPELAAGFNNCNTLVEAALTNVRIHADECKQRIRSGSLTEFAERLKKMENNIEAINELAGINQSLNVLASHGFMISKKMLAEHSDTLSRSLATQIENVWSNDILRQSAPEGDVSRGSNLVDLCSRYMSARDALLIENRHDIAYQHWSMIPRKVEPGQIGYLHRELEKKTKFRSIRELMRSAGAAVQLIKPVIMASPSAIARFLPPQSLLKFDVVIIDEGSQVPPEEALSALARAPQMIIVGDTKQMPPTRYFTKSSLPDGGTDDTALDCESVLSMAVREGIPPELLIYHRRSRDRSLIHLANILHYDGKLETAPSPVRYAPDQGLQLTRVFGATYKRGETATNPVEATAVIDAIKEHTLNYPDRSLGVVTFNIKQAEEILMQLERRAQRDQDLLAFIHKAHPDRPFFVRSLESVQGDERDTIFISVGIGHDPNGDFSMNFGPLGNQGGERRLNVLMTRARWECRLFTSFDPSELRVDSAGAGPKQLKQYLQFAQERSNTSPHTHDNKITPASSAFARALQLKLKRKGLDSEEIKNSDGSYDLAVIDPDDSSCYALSVILDGSKRAETLRAAALPELLFGLESNGWQNFLASTEDLLYRPERLVEEIVSIAHRDTATRSISPKHITATLDRAASAPQPAATSTKVTPYRLASINGGRSLLTGANSDLEAAICEIVRVEAPVHVDEVYFRLRGGIRHTEDLKWLFECRLHDLTLTNAVRREGNFLFPPSERSSNQIRSRFQFASVRKSIEFVYPKEIQAAMLLIAERSLGIATEELAATTLELLGLSSDNTESLEQVGAQMQTLLASGQLLECSGFITKP